MAEIERASRRAGRATAERILDAADELLGELGSDAVSMQAVADRAGVNKALVFYHFKSKADLFERVLERYYRAHLEALDGAFAGEGPLRGRLHRVVDAYFDFIAHNRRYPALIQREVASGSQHELVQRNLRPMYEWMRRALARMVPAEGPLSARHFFVSFSGLVINYFTYAPVLGALWGRDPLALEAVAERRAHVHWMVDTLLDALERETAP